MGTAERFRTVIALLREAASKGPVVAIVSALSRVSRRLSAAVEAVATQSDSSTVVEELTETLGPGT